MLTFANLQRFVSIFIIETIAERKLVIVLSSVLTVLVIGEIGRQEVKCVDIYLPPIRVISNFPSEEISYDSSVLF